MSALPKKVYWRDVLGNPYQQNPTNSMLDDDYLKSGYRGIKGGSQEDTNKVFIHYDRAYVVNWIAKKLVIPMGLHSNELKFNEFQKLISEAIKLAKEQS